MSSKERIYPLEGKRFEKLADKGFFIKNSNPESSEPYVCYYFDPNQAVNYKTWHPEAKWWTLVEDEDKGRDRRWYVVEGYHYVNRLAYLFSLGSPT